MMQIGFAILFFAANSLWAASFRSLVADDPVAQGLKGQGFFASSGSDPIFPASLLGEMSTILEGCKMPSPLDDAHKRAHQYDWHLEVINGSNIELRLHSYTGLAWLPEPIIKVIAGFFRYIPPGVYRAQFLLSDDVGQWVGDEKRQFLYFPKTAYLSIHRAAPLYWHQDKFLGIDRIYRYLGFGIIDQLGISHHELKIALAKKISLRSLGTGLALYSDQEPKVVKTLDSAKGALYFIDQDWSDKGQVLVHQHSGYRAFFKETLHPKRQKFILRVMKAESPY